MMNFLPQIYEDELFYSIISRYKRQAGMISEGAFLKDLYGKSMVHKSLEFPLHISKVVSNLPYTAKINENKIIFKNTMFPLYTAFLPKEYASKVYEKMCENKNGKNDVNVKCIGSNIKLNNFLKYCPLCLKEDLNNNGESYWRRIFQVPGILFCDKHNIELKNSSAIATSNVIGYNCADLDTCSVDNINYIGNDGLFKLNVKYIENVRCLLNHNFDRKEVKFIIDFYIDRLREKGLASVGGTIYMKDFQEVFINYYSHEYLQLMQSDFDINDEANWLRRFVRYTNKNKSVLRHILLLQFLDVELKSLFESNSATGKNVFIRNLTPTFDKDEMRKKWLDIVRDNPNASRVELKKIGKGLHTWIFRYDRQWYEEVSPPSRARNNKNKRRIKDWGKFDKKYLQLVHNAVQDIKSIEGKPIRVCMESIRRNIGANSILKNKKLIKTHKLIEELTEDIESYRIRKIKWAVSEMKNRGLGITPYKVQLFAGFGGDNQNVRDLIEKVLKDMI